MRGEPVQRGAPAVVLDEGIELDHRLPILRATGVRHAVAEVSTQHDDLERLLFVQVARLQIMLERVVVKRSGGDVHRGVPWPQIERRGVGSRHAVRMGLQRTCVVHDAAADEEYALRILDR